MSRLRVLAQDWGAGRVGAPFYALWFLAVYSHWAISIYFVFVSHVVFSCIVVVVVFCAHVHLFGLWVGCRGQVLFSCTLFELSLVSGCRFPVGERMPEGDISFVSDAPSALVRPRSVCAFWFSCRGANIRKGRNEVNKFPLTAPGGWLKSRVS